jgi:hypothetical protein
MFGTVGWYSNHQNKYFAGFGVLGVIFGDFLKISTILFRDFLFSSSKKGKREGGGLHRGKLNQVFIVFICYMVHVNTKRTAR